MAVECPCGHLYECPCGCQACPRCDVPEFRSRIAGAIGRGLADAAAAHRGQLVDVGPWDD
jgi:hypothetical protein